MQDEADENGMQTALCTLVVSEFEVGTLMVDLGDGYTDILCCLQNKTVHNFVNGIYILLSKIFFVLYFRLQLLQSYTRLPPSVSTM